MPRDPVKDFVDRCKAIELGQAGMSRVQIGQALHRPERWVRRTFGRYNPELGPDSLHDHSSRPHGFPNRTIPAVEQAICAMKEAHSAWGRRQIAKQLRWQWREDPCLLPWVSEGRVRRVLARHPELAPPAPKSPPPPRRIDYLACNLLWAADIHQTKLEDGSIWETLHWLDLYSRYELGQITAPRLTEASVLHSFLQVAAERGLPYLLKTDGDKLFYDATSGLPSLLSRVLATLGIHHLVLPRRQPWWNGVVERYVRTCRQEVELPAEGQTERVQQAMEAERCFYNQERCHSSCHDQPPATIYQPSPRRLPPAFDLLQVPITLQPTVVTRQVQGSGRVSVAGGSYPFSRRYAGQAVTVTVDGWQATAQASDGWQRTWNLHPDTEQPQATPLPPSSPKLLTRKVNARGCLTLNHCLYYVGIAWTGQTLIVQPQNDSWMITLPDGATKTLPRKHLLPQPPRHPIPARPNAPAPPPASKTFHARRVTKTGQVAFSHRLYYVGIAHRGLTIYVSPTPDGLAAYTSEQAWITTCPWKPHLQPDKPLCPT